LLYAGGFVRHNSLWFAAPQGELGGRRLRAALAEALIDREESEPVWSIMSQSEKQLIQIQAIRTRLTQVVNILREQEGKR
jgi:hypothetical protein